MTQENPQQPLNVTPSSAEAPHKPADDKEEVYFSGSPMLRAELGQMFVYIVVAIVLAVVITKELIEDGESSWFEGVLLLGMYVILAVGFFHLPDSAADSEQAPSMKQTMSLQSIP